MTDNYIPDHREGHPGARMRRPVIHRDRTFEYRGERWRVAKGSDSPARDGWGYTLVRERDMAEVDGQWFYMYEVRWYLEQCARNDRPLVDE